MAPNAACAVSHSLGGVVLIEYLKSHFLLGRWELIAGVLLLRDSRKCLL